MKRILFFLTLTLGLASIAEARVAKDATESVDANQLQSYERVDSISALAGLDSFEPIDRDTLLIWATPFRPYLVELSFPSVDLPYTFAIGVESTTSRVHARFDSVRVRGIRYPIREIYKLSRDEARQLKR